MSDSTPTPPTRVRRRFNRSERLSLVRTLGFVTLLHVLGWGTLLLFVVPQHFEVGGTVLGVGLGITAYTLGMRHAFDADHIAAIDNVTRKLLDEGKQSVSVGFWFSLGHSSVVFFMVAGIAFGVRALSDGVSNENSGLQQFASIWGPSASSLFLILIGVINAAALVGIIKVLRVMRSTSELDEKTLERHLEARGLLTRILGRVTRAVRKPWHMYPTGFLFGLGFDTVTEIGLLVMAGGAVSANLPWWSIITPPILFAAGMSLLDTLDGAFMNVAYGWAFDQPARKIYYNLVVTALSVFVAVGIGSVGLLAMLTEQTNLNLGPLGFLGALDLEYVGYFTVAVFVLVWVVSVAVWKFGNIEQRWAIPVPARPVE